jgi:hypothetical protein
VPQRTPTPPRCGRELGKPDPQPARNGPRCATTSTTTPPQIQRLAQARHRAVAIEAAGVILEGHAAVAGIAGEYAGGPR